VGPRVSIVLPVRNGARFLPAALASLQQQTEISWQLVVVDDGSTDATAEQLQRAASHDARIQVLTTPPHGIVPALNLALSRTGAPLIARMDADDVAHPMRLEKQCAYLDAHPEVGLVSCLVRFGGLEEKSGGYRRHVDWINSLCDPHQIRCRRFVESPLAHPSAVFRRSVIDEHGAYRVGDFPEDYELWLRWLEGGVIMAKVPEVLLTWNDPPGRLSRNDQRYSVEAFYQLKARYLARWLHQHIAARPVWIWGAGRVTRTRVRWLIQAGARLEGWIDIDPRKVNRRHAGLPVHPPDFLCAPASARPFVLAYVGSWDARETIAGWLNKNRFEEEKDYLLCA
jgi:glycosyltransferase involved in cell wall biosynthesis